jgi:hypothetical protein
LLQQSLPKWPFLPQFEQRIDLPSGPSYDDLFVFFVPSAFPEASPEPSPLPMLLRLHIHACHSSVMNSLPYRSEMKVFLCCPNQARC